MTDQINHADMVAGLMKPGDEITSTLTPKQADLWHGATGVAGETTEVLEAVTQMFITGQLDIQNMVEELGDIEFYMESVRANLGLTRDEVMSFQSEQTFPISGEPLECASLLAIAGGQLLDAVKKHVVYQKDIDLDKVQFALASLEVQVGVIRQAIQVSREETLEANIAKLSVRYKGLKYSDKAAQERADKAVGE
ncbi:putative nucleotide pyrophosphohydrolase domain protein [Erythrobacter phage vB_EliS-L02]|nr:putative nucleotide pyrophosphohydrolase domain protein [Erythrobacter phage vB_EliS-L02]